MATDDLKGCRGILYVIVLIFIGFLLAIGLDQLVTLVAKLWR